MKKKREVEASTYFAHVGKDMDEKLLARELVDECRFLSEDAEKSAARRVRDGR